MATKGYRNDFMDLSDLKFDDLDDPIEASNDPKGGGLCVPQDNLEDVEFFPNFISHLICLPSLLDYVNTVSDDRHGDGFSSQDSQRSSSTGYVESLDIIGSPHQGSKKRVSQEEAHETMAGERNSKHQDEEARSLKHEVKHEDMKEQTSDRVEDEIVPWKGVSALENSKSHWFENYKNGLRTKKVRNKKPRTNRLNTLKTGSMCNSRICNFGNSTSITRKCSHCLSEKTPQWRRGPKGPKTLCNACGVKYMGGKLVPEYRPAASPTFDSSKHSNFHKRILKRKLQEIEYYLEH